MRGTALLAACLAAPPPALASLTRLRYRSGEYPEDGALPGCDPAAHRPGGGLGAHPLRAAAAVEAHLAPACLVAVVGVVGDAGVLEVGLDVPYLYLADHRRYSRGSAFRAWQGLLEAGAAPAEDAKWLRRIFGLSAMAFDLTSGGSASGLAIDWNWAWRAEEWADAYAAGWHHSAFTALGIVAEVICHRIFRAAEQDLQPFAPVCARGPLAEDVAGCEPHAVAVIMDQLRAGVVVGAPEGFVERGATLALAMLSGCDAHSAVGISSLRRSWKTFADMPRHGAKDPAVSCPAPSTRHHYENPPQLLCVDLCEEVQATREVHGASSLTAHILSVAASTFRHGSSSCLVFEIDMFMSSEDECHVTQAGSTMRSVPNAFMTTWMCRLRGAGGRRPPASEASVVSHFGVHSSLRCAFVLDDDAVGLDRATLDLESPIGRIADINLCQGRCAGGAAVGPAPPPQRHITVCTGVLYDLDAAAGPGETPLLLQWLEYHLLVGVSHFYIYDADASGARLLAPYIARGLVTYFPRWPASLSAKLGRVVRDCRGCLNMQMNAHCVARSRGRSRWALLLHGFDSYLASGSGRPSGASFWSAGRPSDVLLASVLSVLDRAWEQIGTVALSMLDFGGPPTNASWLIGRYLFRQAGPVMFTHELARGASRVGSWLNHFGAIMLNPNNVLGALDHFGRSRPGATDVEVPWEFLRVNHYVDAVRPRSQKLIVGCDVPDDGLLERLRTLCSALGLAECGRAPS